MWGNVESGLDPEVERLAHEVIGAAIEVHRQLGPGLSEDMYEKALCIELTRREIPFVSQHRVEVAYRGHVIGERRIDLIVDNKLIVENKAIAMLGEIEKAQALTYLRITGLTLCLLVNFNVTQLRHGIKRIILTDMNSSDSSRPWRSSRLRGSDGPSGPL